MAAAEYYDPLGTRRQDAPLPPLPATSPRPRIDTHNPYGEQNPYASPNGAGPISPFSDHSYPAYPHSGQHKPAQQQPPYDDTAYYGGGGQSDPFADQNAIPLKNSKMASNNSLDPEGRPLRDYRDSRDSDRRRKKGIPGLRGRITWVVYFFTLVQIVVFIAEIVRNGVLTGSPIEIHPQFNPMIGPSPYVMINMGARYVPCMRNTHNITDASSTLYFPCPNTTTSTLTADKACSLSELCGFSGVPNPHPNGTLQDKPEPDQWWRFIIPMFMHAGLIHIGFNLLLQLTMGRDVEKLIGPLRFLLVYVASGIFGFVFGGNFAAPGIASTGASGSLFGILALTLLDLLYNWGARRSPVRDLLFIFLDVAIAFVLGLLPGLDNFSHIGGFLMGLVLGICLLHSPAALRERIGQDEPAFSDIGHAPRTGEDNTGIKAFAKQPVGFFKGRKPAWWVWWLIRAGALIAVFAVFIALLNNFYKYRTTCGWCKYLSCINVNGWCDIGNIQLSSTSSKRDIAESIFGPEVHLHPVRTF